MIISIIVGVLFSFGLTLIILDLLKLPSFATVSIVNRIKRKQSKKISRLEIYFEGIEKWISKKIKLNDYKRLQMVSDLSTANIELTPEEYVSKSIMKSLTIAVFGIPLLLVSPVLSVVIFGISIIIYVFEFRKINKVIQVTRHNIECELPRFVASIEKSLVHSRDVVAILENYIKYASKDLKRELVITVADMKSGNYEVALSRLDKRVGSLMMSEVVRGLIGVIHGDETVSYFSNLNLKFREYEKDELKREASKAPKRVRKLSFVLLMCFMLVYIVVIASVLMNSLGGIAL